MTINYGRPASPEGFITAALITLGRPVSPERDEETPLPCYVVTSINPKHDRHLLCATVTVHSYAKGNTPQEGRAIAEQAAWDADNLLISLTPGDEVMLASGKTASAWVDPVMGPTYADYRDAYIKHYAARYTALLRFTA